MIRRRLNRSLSIGAKTLISHVTLCVVLIALVSVLGYALSSQYVRETRMEELLRKADYIAENAGTNPDGPLMPR